MFKGTQDGGAAQSHEDSKEMGTFHDEEYTASEGNPSEYPMTEVSDEPNCHDTLAVN